MKSQKQSRIMTNMGSYALLQVVTLLVGLVLPRFFLKAYGSEANGVVATVNSFTTYFSYLEAGLGLALVHALYRPLAEENTEKTNQILSFSNRQYRKISGVYFVFVMLLAIVFPIFSDVSCFSKLEFFSLVFVIGLYGALDFYTMAKYRVLLTADRKEYVISNAMIFAQLLRFFFSLVLLQFEISIVFIKLVPVFTLFVRSVILHTYVKRQYKSVDFSVVSISESMNFSHRWDALLLQISINTSTLLPTIIISQLLGFKEANVFSVYSLVISAVISVISALSSGVAPDFGRDLAQGKDLNKKYKVYETLVFYVVAVFFSTASIMILPFIKMYTNVVSDVNYIYPSLAILSAVWGAMHSARIPATAVINAAGLYKENRSNNIVNLLLQILLSIVFTFAWGLQGMLIAMIVSALQRNIWYEVINSKSILKTGLYKRVLKQVFLILVVGASYSIYHFFLSNINYTLMLWVLIAAIVFLSALVVCLGFIVVLDFEGLKAVLSLLSKNKVEK